MRDFIAKLSVIGAYVTLALCISVILGSVITIYCIGIETLNKESSPMAEANNSIAALMKANARLKKNAEVAKKVVARKDYTGPAGDVITKFSNKACLTIDNIPCVILEFRIDGEVPGQEDFNGERIAVFNKFNDDEYGTVESRQAEFFERVQLLGIDTRSMTLEQVDKALDDLRKDSPQITVRVVKKQGKGKNAGKTYTNYFISGIASAVKDDADYSATTDEEVPDDDVPVDEEVSDEWSEELEEEEPAAEDDAAEYSPSDWIGFDVDYKPAKSPKALTFKVIAADDDAGTVTLEKDKKKLKANFADLILP